MADATDDELVELCTSVWIEAIGDGQEEANMATARAVYNRGRADLLSEIKAVLDPLDAGFAVGVPAAVFLELAAQTAEGQGAPVVPEAMRAIAKAVVELLAIVPAEAGE